MGAFLDKNKQVKDQQQGIKCSTQLFDCKHYTNLISILNSYEHNNEEIKLDIDNLNITNTLNDYIHLMNLHENQFEEIFNSFDKICDITACPMFKRNHRQRVKNNHNTDNIEDIFQTVKQQILDKIHCYFKHSYDIGHRILNKDILIDVDEKINFDDHDTINNNLLINQETVKLMNIISTKHKLYRSVDGQDRSKKFNSHVSTVYDINDSKQSEEMNDIMFDTGVMFKYMNNSQNINPSNKDSGYVYVKRKYSSLKQELLSNPLVILSKAQFDSELNKAEIHFNSHHCKTLMKIHETQCQSSNSKPVKLKVHHVLTVMIYCNYDALQYEFSKTYRKTAENEDLQSISDRHRNFFHLGLFLKIIANKFSYETSSYTGGNSNTMCFKTLYHGINKLLMFPLESPGFTHINVPLSTSSEWEVSVNFSTVNGISVEISAGGWMASFFKCDWLSDYGNEKEHLFVQANRHMSFTNVTICQNGIELKLIIQAARILWQFWDYNKIKYRQKISNECKSVTMSLIEHEMEIKVFVSLSVYARNLFHQFCIRKQGIKVDWDLITGNYQFLLKYFRLTQLEWISIEQFVKLYPNIDYIETH
eukprot:357668_1